MKTLLALLLFAAMTLPAWAQEETPSDEAICDPEITTASTFYTAGWDFYRQEDYGLALVQFDCAIALDEDYLDARHMRGLMLEQLEQFDAAIDAYSAVIERDPEYLISYIGLGNSALEIEDYDAAIQYFTEYLSRDSTDAGIYYNRALAHYRSGEFAAAVEDYDRAIERDPSASNAYAGRANALNAMGRHNEALESIDQAFELRINAYAWYFGALGETYLDLRRYDDAKIAFDVYLLLVDEPSNAVLQDIAELESILAEQEIVQAESTVDTEESPQATPVSTDCMVTPIDSANRRNGAGANFSVLGTLTSDRSYAANAQKASEGFIWWRLANGTGWVREDAVTESGDCELVTDLSG